MVLRIWRILPFFGFWDCFSAKFRWLNTPRKSLTELNAPGKLTNRYPKILLKKAVFLVPINGWWFRNPVNSPVEVGSFYPLCRYKVLDISVWFFGISSINSMLNFWGVFTQLNSSHVQTKKNQSQNRSFGGFWSSMQRFSPSIVSGMSR